MPCSRRNVMLNASAVNVADITAMPAIPGMKWLSPSWSRLNTLAISTRKMSGSAKLKNAALGLRQNMRRWKRNSRHARAVALTARAPQAAEARSRHRLGREGGRLLLGRQLEVDVLERRPRHGQVLEPLAARQRLAGHAVEQLRRVVGLHLHAAPVLVPGHAVGGAARGQLARRAGGDDQAVLDDRDAIGQLLRLVEVVGREQHGLVELLEPADHAPRGAPRGGVEARRGLVEEHQLGVAHQRQRQVEPAPLPTRELSRALVLVAVESHERDGLPYV